MPECTGLVVSFDRRRVSDEIVEEMARALMMAKSAFVAIHATDDLYLPPVALDAITVNDSALSRYRKAKEEVK